MKNFFIYKRKLEDGTEVKDSFNIDRVIRTVTIEDGQVVVLLDDYHERISVVPITNKQKVVVDYKRERNTHQSEIFLSKEDGERFYDQISDEYEQVTE